jgi:tRNA (guanine37-N1)-methyltransferase
MKARFFFRLIMTTFHILTTFEDSIKGYFNSSILARAGEKRLIKIKFYNPRDFASGKYKKTDERPFGGGPGMVMMLEPIIKTISKIKSKISKFNVKIILMTPAGKQFEQKTAINWAKKFKDIIIICGRYEGIDERINKIFKTEKISVGPYVLTGGELGAEIIVDAVSRQIKGVLGKEESIEEKREGVGVPTYTRPEIFKYKGKNYKVPKILLSGNHAKIREWRKSATGTKNKK